MRETEKLLARREKLEEEAKYDEREREEERMRRRGWERARETKVILNPGGDF